MCTALCLESLEGFHFFGRNMDIECGFNQKILCVPRGFEYYDKRKVQYAVMGMGSLIDSHPLLADGFNEKGLACAALNFPHYAHYETNSQKNKIPAYEFLLHLLASYESVSEIHADIHNFSICSDAFRENLPVPPLHWIVYDKYGDCITIEMTKNRFDVFENNVGVLSNSPEFTWHLTNLSHYIPLTNKQIPSTNWGEQTLTAVGQGVGLHSLPGDFYPSSRFVRAAYFRSIANKKHEKFKCRNIFFRILQNLSFIEGAVITEKGETDFTLYSSCICLEDLSYCYTCIDSFQLNIAHMKDEHIFSSTTTEIPFENTNIKTHKLF